MIASAIVDISSLFINYGSNKHNTLWIGNLFTIIEGLFLFYYFLIISREKFNRNITLLFSSIFLATWLIQNIVLGKFLRLDNLSVGVESLLLIILAILFFFQIVRKSDDLLIYTRPNFWIVTAFLIYASGTFFLYISWNALSQMKSANAIYTLINAIFLILKNVLLTVAFLLKEPVETKKTLNQRTKYLDDLLKD